MGGWQILAGHVLKDSLPGAYEMGVSSFCLQKHKQTESYFTERWNSIGQQTED